MIRESLLEGIDPEVRSSAKNHQVIIDDFREKALCPKFTGRIAAYFFVALFLFLPFSLLSQKTTVIDSLEHVLKTAKADSNKVNLLISLATLFKDINSDSAFHFAKSAQIIAEKNNDSSFMMSLARKIISLAMYYRRTRDFSKAEELLLVCLSLREKAGNEYALIGTYVNLSIIHNYQRKYDKGISAGIKAKEIGLKYFHAPDSAIRAGACIGIGDSYYRLGQIYYEKGEYNNAIRNFVESGYYRNITGGQMRKGQSLSGLARIYVKQNNYPAALKYFNLALTYYKEINSVTGIAMVLRSIGDIYGLQHNYSRALTYYNNSLSLQIEKNQDFDFNVTYQMIGDLYFKIRCLPEDKMFEVMPSFRVFGVEQAFLFLTDSAKYFLSKAYELSKQTGDELIMIKSMQGLADISSMQKDFDRAISQLNEVVTLAKNIDAKPELFEGYRSLSVVLEKFNRYEEAYYYYKLSAAIKDSVFNEHSTKQIAEIEIKYETNKKEKEIELLNKENSIKALQMEQQNVSLLASKFELENNRNEILLLNKSNDLQQLQLVKTQEDRDHQLLAVKAKTAGMDLIKKEKELKVQQLKEQKLLRNGILAGTVLLLLLGLFLFRSLHLRKKLEKQKAIIQERKRISADLHDDIGSGLSKISLLSEMVKQQAKSTEARIEAEKIAKIARELLDSIREIIWALNANNDYLENLVAFIRKNAAEYFENSNVKLRIETPGKIPQKSISGEYRRNVFYSVKEAMHNIVKHSGATEAEVKFTIEDDVFSISIKDNGKGFPEGELNRFGNGIKNIMSRMETIHGNVTIENHVGTKITLALPV